MKAFSKLEFKTIKYKIRRGKYKKVTKIFENMLDQIPKYGILLN